MHTYIYTRANKHVYIYFKYIYIYLYLYIYIYIYISLTKTDGYNVREGESKKERGWLGSRCTNSQIDKHGEIWQSKQMGMAFARTESSWRILWVKMEKKSIKKNEKIQNKMLCPPTKKRKEKKMKQKNAITSASRKPLDGWKFVHEWNILQLGKELRWS